MASDHCLVPSPVKTPYSILNLLEQYPTTHAVFFTPVLHKDHNVYVVLRGRWDFADTFNIRLRNREQIRVCLFHVSKRWDAPRPKYPPSKRFQKNWHRKKKMATSWRGLIDQVCRIAGYFSHTQCGYPKQHSSSRSAWTSRLPSLRFRSWISLTINFIIPAGGIYADASAIRIDGNTSFSGNSAQGEQAKTSIQAEHASSLD